MYGLVSGLASRKSAIKHAAVAALALFAAMQAALPTPALALGGLSENLYNNTGTVLPNSSGCVINSTINSSTSAQSLGSPAVSVPAQTARLSFKASAGAASIYNVVYPQVRFNVPFLGQTQAAVEANLASFCGLTEVAITDWQPAPSTPASDAAAAAMFPGVSYMGIKFTAKRLDVAYNYEIAFSGQTTTQLKISSAVRASTTLSLAASPSATQQTAGRNYTYTLTPSATGADTSGTLTLSTTLPPSLAYVSGAGTGWSCSATGQDVNCTSSTAITAGSNGNPVTLTVTPASAGNVDASFTLSGGGASASAPASAAQVTVNAAVTTTAPSPTSMAFIQGQAGSVTPVTMSGGTSPFTWSISPSLPTGLSISSSTGQISGTPTVLSAATDYTITATDARGSASSQTFNIAVNSPVSSIATLSGLSLSQGTLTPAFATATKSYTALVGNAVASLTVTPTVTNSAATVTVNGVSVSSGAASGAIALAVGANTITVIVTAEDGTTTDTYTATVTRADVPAVTGLSPASGSTLGGTSVTITGTQFTGATQVSFGGTAATNFVVNSATSITATAPARAAGAVDVVVTTPEGASANTSADNFTYGAPPGLTSFTHNATVAYNTGAAAATSINVAAQGSATQSPTSYQITTASANGATVSTNSSGLVSYTPATGFRGNDTFAITATNSFGTSAPATVTVTVGNPNFATNQTSQTGTFDTAITAIDVTITGGKSPYSAFSATGLPPGLAISAAGQITGTPTAAGNYTVAVQATDSSSPAFTGTAAAFSFTISKANQTITFADPGAKTMGTSPQLSATASSGLTVSFTSTTPAVCTITTAGALTPVSAGSCSIDADQAGDANRNAATKVTRAFAISKAANTITFADPGAQTMGTSPQLSATASSGLTVSFTSTTPAVCTITTAGALTPVSAGTCSIDADQAGNGTWEAGTKVTRAFTISKASQTVTFADPGAQTMGTSPQLSATASSGLTVSFTSTTPAVCTITNSGALTPVSAGTCSIDADQAGNGTWEAATKITRAFTISKAANTITFADPGAKTMGTSPQLSATASSSLGVTFTSSTPAVCTVTSAGVLTPVSMGTCSIDADQAGNGTWEAAATVTRAFTISKAVNAIAFANPGDQTLGTSPQLSATASSGLAVSFTSTTPAVCTVTSAGVLTPVSAGTCSISVDQAGNGTWEAASTVTRAFTIGKAANTITFTDPGPQVFGTQPQLTATASSGLPVQFSTTTPAICTVTAQGSLTFLKVGQCTIAADQPGDATHAPATTVTRNLAVGGENPTVQKKLIEDMQMARARSLVLLQPQLIPFLTDAVVSRDLNLLLTPGTGKVDILQVSDQAWIRLAGARTTDDDGSRDHYGQLSFGSHLKMDSNSVLGLMVTLDTIRQTQSFGSSEGEGWMVGPYFASQLGDSPVYFEARALTGRTSDKISETGFAANDVGGKSTLLMAKLAGSHEMNGLMLMPNVNIARVTQKSDAYDTSGGLQIGQVKSDYNEGSLGADVSWSTSNSFGMVTLSGGLGLFISQDSVNGSGSGLTYRLGLTQNMGKGIDLSLGASSQTDLEANSDSHGLTLDLVVNF